MGQMIGYIHTNVHTDDDTIGSMAFRHNQFEYPENDDNNPLTFYMLNSKQLSGYGVSICTFQDLIQ
mgnify:CR=1 FL=1